MSMWQFMMAIDGYVSANSDEENGATEAELEDVWSWMQSRT